MKWAVVAPFFEKKDDRWIDDFAHGKGHQFIHISAPVVAEASWHNRGRLAGLRRWIIFWRHCSKALSSNNCNGYITVFPQLAAIIGFRQRFVVRKKPLVAWTFNLGRCYPGIRQKLSRFAFKYVDFFIVHSSSEVEEYSLWLNLPRERFVFVPLQRGVRAITHQEDNYNPFILSMGTARRDYRTFFECVTQLNIRTVVVAGKASLAGLEIPDCVELRRDLTQEQCLILAQQARVNVIPIDNERTGSGQITFLSAMGMGKAVVVTRCVGSQDYIKNNETGVLVEPQSSKDLYDAIKKLWGNESLRQQMGKNARAYSLQYFSDEAVAVSLISVLNKVL